MKHETSNRDAWRRLSKAWPSLMTNGRRRRRRLPGVRWNKASGYWPGLGILLVGATDPACLPPDPPDPPDPRQLPPTASYCLLLPPTASSPVAAMVGMVGMVGMGGRTPPVSRSTPHTPQRLC
jgi:hypothetical protein